MADKKIQWRGRWAVVTGASAGIGAELARQLAAVGVNLVLTARRRERLESLASELATQHGVETRVLMADLNDASAPEAIYAATEGAGLAVDILINNAGLGQYGEFHHSKIEQELSMIRVNCLASVYLARLFLPRMVERRRGWVMMLGSTASYQPVPYMTTYAATKAFDRYVGEALAEEMAPHGVVVSTLCPGPTVSEFLEVAGARKRDFRQHQSTDDVVRQGLDALASGQRTLIPYLGGRLQTFAQRLVPRRLVVAAAGRMFRPETAK